MQSRRTVLGSAGGLMLAAGLGVGMGRGARVARAQDTGGPHPAHIHVGTVDAPGEVVFPLGDVSAEFLVDGEATAGEAVGQATAVAVIGSVTTVDVSLSAIIEGGHVVMVHESAEAIDVYVAGGDIGGTMTGANDLVIGLKELNESGLSGIAILHDNGDETTAVSVYLTSRAGSNAAGAEQSSPVAEAGETGAAAGVTVPILNFKFGAGEDAPVEVGVGATVTWMNQDSVPHTVTSDDGGTTIQSGKISAGDSFSYTFAEAGEFAYHCEYHTGMKATVIVS